MKRLDVSMPSDLILNCELREIRVWALIRAIQGPAGTTCRVSHIAIGRKAEDFSMKRIDRANIRKAVKSLVEKRYLIPIDRGLRCCTPAPDGGAVDAYAWLQDSPWAGAAYEARHFPEPPPPEQDGVTSTPLMGSDQPRDGVKSTPLFFQDGVKSTPLMGSNRPHHGVKSTPSNALYTARETDFKQTKQTPPPPLSASQEGESPPGRGGGVSQKDLIEKLVDRGVTEINPQAPMDAVRLVEQFEPDRIQRQIRHHDHLCSIGQPPSSGGWLISAIQHDAALPAAIRKRKSPHGPARAPNEERGSPQAVAYEELARRLGQDELSGLRSRAIEALRTIPPELVTETVIRGEMASLFESGQNRPDSPPTAKSDAECSRKQGDAP